MTLADRVRSEIFRAGRRAQGRRLGRRPGRASPTCAARSPDDQWIDRFGKDARKVTGIDGVKNLLHTPGARRRRRDPRGDHVACARVTVPGPRREHDQQARVGDRLGRVALVRVEHGGAARAAGLPAELDLAVDHDHVGALVDLVVLQFLARGEVDQDRPRFTARGMQDLRLVRLDVEGAQVPMLHARGSYASTRILAEPRDRLADDPRHVHLRRRRCARRSPPASDPRRSAAAAPRARARSAPASGARRSRRPRPR